MPVAVRESCANLLSTLMSTATSKAPSMTRGMLDHLLFVASHVQPSDPHTLVRAAAGHGLRVLMCMVLQLAACAETLKALLGVPELVKRCVQHPASRCIFDALRASNHSQHAPLVNQLLELAPDLNRPSLNDAPVDVQALLQALLDAGSDGAALLSAMHSIQHWANNAGEPQLAMFFQNSGLKVLLSAPLFECAPAAERCLSLLDTALPTWFNGDACEALKGWVGKFMALINVVSHTSVQAIVRLMSKHVTHSKVWLQVCSQAIETLSPVMCCEFVTNVRGLVVARHSKQTHMCCRSAWRLHGLPCLF